MHLVQDVLHRYLDVFVVVFIVDILVYSRNIEEHAKHLRRIFERLRKHQLLVKAPKCILNVTEVEFFGQWGMPEGVAPIAKKLHAVRDWEPLTVSKMSDPSRGLQTTTASLSLDMLALHPH